MAGATTFFALSTAPGRAGIAVVRVCGPLARVTLTRLGGKADRPRVACLAKLRDPESGRPLDDALTLWFPGPASETGDDMAELHLHGGRAVVEAVLDALGRSPGLVAAGPGDFVRRAFDNGKLDLTAVEGLADLIAADTEAQRVQALRQLEGGLGALYEGWRGVLLRALAHYEAGIDFADEDLPGDVAAGARAGVSALAREIAGHLDDARRGERLREGYRVVVAGPPNAGKSSLLNALARREAAIVAEEPGTTRDVIDVALDLAGYPVLVTDTAGIREAAGAVEAEGIRRAEARMAQADLVLWLRDCSGGGSSPPPNLGSRVIELWSKCDLGSPPPGALACSTRTGDGLVALVDSVVERVEFELGGGGGPALTRTRHRRELESVHAALCRALDHGSGDTELAAEDLRAAAAALGRLTGRVDVEELLGVIFADFCIGK